MMSRSLVQGIDGQTSCLRLVAGFQDQAFHHLRLFRRPTADIAGEDGTNSLTNYLMIICNE